MAEYISVIDVATQLGRRKQTIFKVMKRLGIEPVKRRDASSGNQQVSYITRDAVIAIRRDLESVEGVARDIPALLDDLEQGVFYLVQLEPDIDPVRFKVGFTVSIQERLTKLRCSAPFAVVVGTWSCRRRWERTAIDCVTATCAQLHTEVFRTTSLEAVRRRCSEFFDLMAQVSEPVTVRDDPTTESAAP
jgi:hypothetical protein